LAETDGSGGVVPVAVVEGGLGRAHGRILALTECGPQRFFRLMSGVARKGTISPREAEDLFEKRMHRRESSLSGLVARVLAVRRATIQLVEPLEIDDWGAQSMPDASPVKWHLAHTTWFFERFVLRSGTNADKHDYLFNSYYESVGARQPRSQRGLLTRPTAAEVLAYRRAIDARLSELGERPYRSDVAEALELGMNHEQQHQELLLTDVKHLFAANPLEPAYLPRCTVEHPAIDFAWRRVGEGVAMIGHGGDAFAFDNERPRHDVLVAPFEIARRLVTCGEYLAFIEDGGYRRPRLWLSEGWSWAREASAPLYWNLEDRTVYTLGGRRPILASEPVCHVNYYEADAYARWAGARLPREDEWEVAAHREDGNFLETAALHPVPAVNEQFFGDAWEWTASAYLPYPGFKPLAGAFGEYNGKFMVGQMVLRGGSCATPRDHIRATYRNFFPASAAWQFTGIRLARDPS
jgi:ergothioneine biosynthesis protein EgtB